MFTPKDCLSYQTIHPQRISSTCLVKSPNAFLWKEGETTLLCPLGEANLVIDYGEEIVGGINIRISCKESTHITVIYDESAQNALRRDPYFCGWCEQVKDEYDLPAGEHTLNSLGRRAFRFIGLFAQSKEPVTLISADAITGNWPIRFRGSFRCNDELINRAWDISAATVRACMQEYYEDGVKRDGLLWVGDYRLTFLCGYYVFGDSSLARKSLLMIRDSQYENGAIPACAARGGGQIHNIESGICYMPGIPYGYCETCILINYMCEYICGIDDYFRLTGDFSLLPEIFDSAAKAMHFLFSITDMETPGVWEIDKYRSTPDKDGLIYDIQYDCSINPPANSGTKGTFLLHLYGAATAFQNLARRAKDDALYAWITEAKDRLDTHIETHYREEKYGLYLDEKGQSLAVTLQYTAIMAALVGKKNPVGIQQMIHAIMPSWGYTMTLKLAALFAAGYPKAALDTVRSAWGKMIKADSKTCWERLDLPELEATHPINAPVSYCHGWSAGPAWALPQWITGINAESDGFSDICIKPELGDLEWAEASVPTPHGELMVRLERCENGMKLYLDIPEGVHTCSVQWSENNTVFLEHCGQYTLFSKE